jgi:hypothetical protein
LYAFSLGTASSTPWCLAFIPLPALRGKALFCCSLDLVASPPVNTSLLLDSVNKESHVGRKSRHELTIWISTSPPVAPPRSADKMHQLGFSKQFNHFSWISRVSIGMNGLQNLYTSCILWTKVNTFLLLIPASCFVEDDY